MKRILFLLVLLVASCSPKDQFYVLFNEAIPLEEGSPLLINGYQLGEINHLELIDEQRVVATVVITEDVAIPVDSKFSTRHSNLFGDIPELNLSMGKSNIAVAAGDTLIGIHENSNEADPLLEVLKDLIQFLGDTSSTSQDSSANQ